MKRPMAKLSIPYTHDWPFTESLPLICTTWKCVNSLTMSNQLNAKVYTAGQAKKKATTSLNPKLAWILDTTQTTHMLRQSLHKLLQVGDQMIVKLLWLCFSWIFMENWRHNVPITFECMEQYFLVIAPNSPFVAATLDRQCGLRRSKLWHQVWTRLEQED